MGKNSIVDKNKIYVVKMAGYEKALELAMYADPDYYGFKGICYFTPIDRGHMIRGKLGEKTDTGFTFIAGEDSFAPGVWEFIELTYENFKNEYYKIVEAGEELLAQVSNTAELEEFYHKHFPD